MAKKDNSTQEEPLEKQRWKGADKLRKNIDAALPANTNQAVAILRINKEKCFSEFVYLFLKSSQFRDVIDEKIVHAVQPNLSLGEIGSTELKIPPLELINDFKKLVVHVFVKKNSNAEQIRTLKKMLDTLLPKLMNGEVRVEM